MRFPINISQDCYLDIELVLFKQAIFNIVQNVIEFAPLGSTFTISLALSKDFIQIIFEDQGAGIAFAYLKKHRPWPDLY